LNCLTERGLGRRTLVMGVLNVTPDSFSDGGLFADTDSAIRRAEAMAAAGVDIIDIGGESTRPATFGDRSPLDPGEEIRRIRPIIELVRTELPDTLISVDTYKSSVAEVALDCGADILNDISALTYDPAIGRLAASRRVPLMLMHILGEPRNISLSPHYEDVVVEVAAFLKGQAQTAIDFGVPQEDIVIDPGIGFGKTSEHNLELIRRLREFCGLGYPILIGPSRKRFLGKITGVEDPAGRRDATAASIALSVAGGADIVRVHDVREMVHVVKVADAIVRGWSETSGS